ncbi:MAG TPA: hypothetical protein VMG08_16630 [Allosphingosinicella sp.]|nr:hypothetical protein [Allosphingosinicella sp.]
MSDFHEGQRILAQWDGGSFWFPGEVHSVGADGAVAIRYDDGMSDIRPVGQVKPFDWRVGSRIDAIWSGNGQWYAARIMDMAEDGRSVLVRFEDDGIREGRQTGECRSS